MTKMNPELKAKWIEALRSGKYQQAKARLRTAESRFCCLGVLAEVQGATWDHFDCPFIAGEMVRAKMGDWLKDNAAGGLTMGQQTRLSDMNDTGSSFAQIADYIEEHL